MIISVRIGRKFLLVNIGKMAYQSILWKSGGKKEKIRNNKFYIIVKAKEAKKTYVNRKFAKKCLSA